MALPRQGVGPLLGDRVHDPRRGGAVLGIELVGHDLEFLNRLERRSAPAHPPSPRAGRRCCCRRPSGTRHRWNLPLMVTLSDDESAAALYTTPGSIRRRL